MTGNVFFYIPPIQMVTGGWLGEETSISQTSLERWLGASSPIYLPYFRLGNYDHLPKTHGIWGAIFGGSPNL